MPGLIRDAAKSVNSEINEAILGLFSGTQEAGQLEPVAIGGGDIANKVKEAQKEVEEIKNLSGQKPDTSFFDVIKQSVNESSDSINLRLLTALSAVTINPDTLSSTVLDVLPKPINLLTKRENSFLKNLNSVKVTAKPAPPPKTPISVPISLAKVVTIEEAPKS